MSVHLLSGKKLTSYAVNSFHSPKNEALPPLTWNMFGSTCSMKHTDRIFDYSSLLNSFRSSWILGFLLHPHLYSLLQTSVVLRSENLGGCLIRCLLIHFCVTLEKCFESLSYWKIQWHYFSSFWQRSPFSYKNSAWWNALKVSMALGRDAGP